MAWAEVPIRGGSVKLDVQDLWLLEQGSYRVLYRRDGSPGYAVRSSWRRTHYLHREVLGLLPGDGLEGDHRNRDRFDNRRANLRIATRALNAQNVPARSGYRGVTWSEEDGVWIAQANLARRHVSIARCATEEQAAAAARAWRAEHMPFARG